MASLLAARHAPVIQAKALHDNTDEGHKQPQGGDGVLFLLKRRLILLYHGGMD